jgi:Na+/H+ antiporter NhaD/arsenite permease-like protein
MSNTASAALLCPLGIAIANGIGVSPQAVVMAIAIAASCAFATPVGTPPNTLVFGAGGYKFMDYVKCGTPLVIIEMIVCIILIPMIWPFLSRNRPGIAQVARETDDALRRAVLPKRVGAERGRAIRLPIPAKLGAVLKTKGVPLICRSAR